MIKFEIAQHKVRRGVPIIEVKVGQKFIATIVPMDDVEGRPGFRILSRYVELTKTGTGILDGVVTWNFQLKAPDASATPQSDPKV